MTIIKKDPLAYLQVDGMNLVIKIARQLTWKVSRPDLFKDACNDAWVEILSTIKARGPNFHYENPSAYFKKVVINAVNSTITEEFKRQGGIDIRRYLDSLHLLTRTDKLGFLKICKIDAVSLHGMELNEIVRREIIATLEMTTPPYRVYIQISLDEDEDLDGGDLDGGRLSGSDNSHDSINKLDAEKLLSAVDAYLNACVQTYVKGKKPPGNDPQKVTQAFLSYFVDKVTGREIQEDTGLTQPQQVQIRTDIKACIARRAVGAGFGSVIDQAKKI